MVFIVLTRQIKGHYALIFLSERGEDMKLISLRCPDCNGDIDVKFKGNDFIFCPYCGTQIYVDNEADVKIYTYNINKTEIIEDKAQIEKERRERTESIGETITTVAFLIVIFFIILVCVFVKYFR